MRSSEDVDRRGILVDYDPAVWFPGPRRDAAPEWIDRALAACSSDFGVTAGSVEAGYLREVLTVFAAADVGGDLRFLLLRNVVDVPLVARVSAY